MKISFNLRVGYNAANDCVKYIESIGGIGQIVCGGSWYSGTTAQIDKLLVYMGEKDYDLAPMAINEDPEVTTQRRVDSLKEQGIIKNNKGDILI